MRFVQFLFFRHTLVHRFRNNYTTRLFANPIVQVQKSQRSPEKNTIAMPVCQVFYMMQHAVMNAFHSVRGKP